MKNLFFLILTLLLMPGFSKSQTTVSKDMEKCGKPKFEEKCIKRTLPPADYTYLSSWDYTSGDSLNVKFSVLLKRNISYVFNICDGSGDDVMVLNLSDSNDTLLLSSENKKTKKNDRFIFFRPKESGKFYISTHFKKEEQDCCLIMQFICGIKNFKIYK